MFWKNKDLKHENTKLKIEIDVLKLQLKTIENQITEADVFIDFDRMKVFSIERSIKDGKTPCTIIGYYMNDPIVSYDGEMIVNRDVVREWNIYCSDKQHTELIANFKIWKKLNV